MDINTIRFVIFLGVFIILLLLESIIPRHPTVDSKPRRFGINLGLTGIDIVIVKVVFGTAAVGAATFAQEKGWGMLNLFHWPEGLEMLLSLVILDFMIYIQHVVVHTIPFFWKFHVVHHSDLDLDVSSGLRFHPVEILGSMLYKIGIVLALGPSPVSVLIFEAILNGMSQFTHSNIQLPDWCDRLLRYILVTPDMHRIHHSIEINETNSNFGFNFSIWDRFLGTYLQDGKRSQPNIKIGIDAFQNPEKLSLNRLLLMPFRQIPRSYTIDPEVK